MGLDMFQVVICLLFNEFCGHKAKLILVPTIRVVSRLRYYHTSLN
jgi:hypothetical protein